MSKKREGGVMRILFLTGHGKLNSDRNSNIPRGHYVLFGAVQMEIMIFDGEQRVFLVMFVAVPRILRRDSRQF